MKKKIGYSKEYRNIQKLGHCPQCGGQLFCKGLFDLYCGGHPPVRGQTAGDTGCGYSYRDVKYESELNETKQEGD